MLLGRKNSILNQGLGNRNREGSIREKIVLQNKFFDDETIVEEDHEPESGAIGSINSTGKFSANDLLNLRP